MGFGDKLKGLRDQAQAAVADNKDKIQGAVQSAGEVANTKTHGKYADKIVKVGDKMNASVEKLSGAPEEGGTSAQASGADAGTTAPGAGTGFSAEPPAGTPADSVAEATDETASRPATAGGAAPDFDE